MVAKSADFARNYARKIYFVNVPQNIPRGNIPPCPFPRIMLYLFFFRKHGILRHSSNYPSFVNSRMSSHPDIPVYNPVRQLADNYFNDARSMKLGKRVRFSFLRVIKGINQTNKSNTVEENNRGEGTNMFRIYDLDAFIDRPIYMHDLYALYEVSFKVLPIWREPTRSFENCIIIFPRCIPRVYDFRVFRDKLWEKVKGFRYT